MSTSGGAGEHHTLRGGAQSGVRLSYEGNTSVLQAMPVERTSGRRLPWRPPPPPPLESSAAGLLGLLLPSPPPSGSRFSLTDEELVLDFLKHRISVGAHGFVHLQRRRLQVPHLPAMASRAGA
jgi:hypothetical protein